MPTRLPLLLPLLVAGTILLGSGPTGAAQADDLALGFDDEQPSWSPHFEPSRVQLLSHRRNAHLRVGGAAAEHLEFKASQVGGRVVLEHAVDPARVIPDLKLSLWVRSNRGGARLLLRVVFPQETDPATGAILSTYLAGDSYTDAGKWQQLTCATTDRLMSEQIVRLRARLKRSEINTRGIYVDQAVVSLDLSPDATELFLDELRLGPIVSPQPETPILPAGGTSEAAGPPVEFRLDHLLVEDRPFLPRVMAWHGEPFDQLQQTGINVAWVPRYDDEGVLAELRRRGMWATATPPRATAGSGELLDAGAATMLPFTRETAPILFWNLGTRIPPESKSELVNWAEQIRTADHAARRPIMVDVTGMEKVVSRQVPMLGVSRHILQTSFTIKQYRDWLIGKRKLARPGSFVWTWVQTEPAALHADTRAAAHQAPVVVEPEQIRLQVYAALSAGCRGIGYWKTTPLDSEAPGAAERRLILAQLNLELGLLEPWLATGSLSNHVPFEINRPAQVQLGQRGLGFRNSPAERHEGQAILRAQDAGAAEAAQLPGELEAAVIQSHEYGLLLLPMWYERQSQYVPGQLAANDASMIVSGVPDTASAWEVTPTRVHNLDAVRDVGGLRITLPKFDQTASIVLTSDQKIIQQLRARVAQTAEPSARIAMQLAKAKLERVRGVDTELRSAVGFGRGGQPDGQQLLASAERQLASAEQAFAIRNYDGARQASDDCLQLLRILQRAHWYDAVSRLTAAPASPHTVSFQTLPDHWRMVAQIGRSPAGEQVNLLRSGDFEDMDTMVVEGWKHAQETLDGIRATAELYPAARQGKYALRLIAVPAAGQDPPAVVSRSPVTVTTPDVTVRSGQVVYVSGWIRIAAPIFGSLDGAMVYDSIGGPVSALRFHTKSGWQRFELIREVHESGRLNVTVALGGIGEVHLDDLQIVPHTPRTEPVRAAEDPQDATKGKGFDFWNRVPRLNPLNPLAPRR